MLIEIKDQEDKIVFSNDQLDNPNFVDITIQMESGNSVTTTMPVNELVAAVMAFQNLKIQTREDDNLRT